MSVTAVTRGVPAIVINHAAVNDHWPIVIVIAGPFIADYFPVTRAMVGIIVIAAPIIAIVGLGLRPDHGHGCDGEDCQY